jgi:NAD(P)-dependent dehydrogenase (short-subunit alcohol dehydrogenase family)
MRVLVIGATGTIGREVAEALQARHEVLRASRTSDLKIDISDPVSVAALFTALGPLDAVVCAAGEARFKRLEQLTQEDFDVSLTSKLMGQVRVAQLAVPSLRDGGSITLTSGVLARKPQVGSAAISLVNAGLEGFVRAAALELPRGLRINVVSPPWVAETLRQMGADPSAGLPAAQVALAYVASVEGEGSGEVLEPAAV